MILARAMFRTGLPLLAATLAGVGCSKSDASTADPATGTAEAPIAGQLDPGDIVLEHDFGSLRHGDVVTHDFDITAAHDAVGYAPIGFRSGCSCAGHRFVIIDRLGSEREVDHLPHAYKTLQQGDRLLLRLTIDTNLKEAVDQERRTLDGAAILQRAEGDEDHPHVPLPVRFHFAIDSPVSVQPAAHVDFGTLPLAKTLTRTVELIADTPGVVFGPALVDNGRVVATLHGVENGRQKLDLHIDPRAGTGALGPLTATITVSSTLEPAYTLRIPVSGQVIPEIQVEPWPDLSFGRIPFDEPTGDDKFLLLTDHADREPGFEVRGIIDRKGVSLAEHFEARLDPLVGAPHQARLTLRYLGTLDGDSFRGVVRVGKPASPKVVVEIPFYGFRKADH